MTIFWDPDEGMARQGDVILWRLPDGFEPSRDEVIAARDGRIILAEGEATGHHHSILAHMFEPLRFRDESVAGVAESNFKSTVGHATFVRDAALVAKLARQHLTTPALCVGFLIVEHAAVSLDHQEHDSILIPPGAYYVGRQQEFNAGEMRRVQD